METLTADDRFILFTTTRQATPREVSQRNQAYRTRQRSQVSLGPAGAAEADTWMADKTQAWTREHAKIGVGGKKVHRVLAHWEIAHGVRYLLSAYSLCGSARFTLGGPSRIQILGDGLECNCEKCVAQSTPRRATQ